MDVMQYQATTSSILCLQHTLYTSFTLHNSIILLLSSRPVFIIAYSYFPSCFPLWFMTSLPLAPSLSLLSPGGFLCLRPFGQDPSLLSGHTFFPYIFHSYIRFSVFSQPSVLRGVYIQYYYQLYHAIVTDFFVFVFQLCIRQHRVSLSMSLFVSQFFPFPLQFPFNYPPFLFLSIFHFFSTTPFSLLLLFASILYFPSTVPFSSSSPFILYLPFLFNCSLFLILSFYLTPSTSLQLALFPLSSLLLSYHLSLTITRRSFPVPSSPPWLHPSPTLRSTPWRGSRRLLTNVASNGAGANSQFFFAPEYVMVYSTPPDPRLMYTERFVHVPPAGTGVW